VEKWIFFGDTLVRGKKSDTIFHNSCLTHIIKFYDDERKQQGKDTIPINICHTDNCAGQYKCRQTFLEVAMSCSSRDTTMAHKFAQKYGFKGSWDAIGKLIKQAINRLELRNERVSNTFDCYKKLGKELSKASLAWAQRTERSMIGW